MESILVILHTEPDGSLGPPALEAIGAARMLQDAAPGTSFAVGLLGPDLEEAARSIAGCGAERVLGASGAHFEQARYATDAAAAEAICAAAGASIVLAPATSRWSRVLPGVSYRLEGRTDTHVTGLSVQDDKVQVTRWFYRQRMRGTIQRSQRPWFILLDPGSQAAWQGADAGTEAPTVEAVQVQLDKANLKTEVTGVRAPGAAQQTIRPDADLLFVAGAGWTKKQPDGDIHIAEAESLITDFLECTQASLGSSKSLVDLGAEGEHVLSILTHLNQIGQTGSTPRHPKGLATCCHGEEPHVVGWRFINERRAICLDPNCGWAQGKADVLYVADAFEVMKELNQLL